jgi:serine/threonine protein phosphatase PrpC
MTVVCMACGKESQDPEFCDHCNADLLPPATRLPPTLCPLPTGPAELSTEQRVALHRVEAAITLDADEKKWRVHWVAPADLPSWRLRLQQRVESRLTCLPPLELREDAGGLWVLVEATGQPWSPWSSTSSDPVQRVAEVVEATRRLAAALMELHAHGLVCLTFEPTAIEETPDGHLRFVNLDTEVYRADALPERVTAHHNFVAPEVSTFRAAEVGPRTDVYHLGLFAYYWLAGLLPQGFPGNGLEAFEHDIPFLRIYAPALPEGVCPVVAQALAIEPAKRFATPLELVEALGTAVERARHRRSFAGGLTWDIGNHARTGRTKTALHWDNEDQTMIKLFPEEKAALAAVADGVSTCHVGSGGLASLLTVVVLEATFAFGSTHESFPQQAIHACKRAAQSLVDWALEKGYRSQLKRGADLMGTTLTVGWLQGRRLSLANLGDSRAYLITSEGPAEQLTVDGDLASALLGRRVAPEDVRGLGYAGRSLRECVGGCVVTAEGEIKPMPESGKPALTSWPLLPGDTIVLCTDGLVEEGIFLDAVTLAELVRKHRSASAGELAVLLADEADALQQPPSSVDPDGLGDNIGCVVIKIDAGEASPGATPAGAS